MEYFPVTVEDDYIKFDCDEWVAAILRDGATDRTEFYSDVVERSGWGREVGGQRRWQAHKVETLRKAAERDRRAYDQTFSFWSGNADSNHYDDVAVDAVSLPNGNVLCFIERAPMGYVSGFDYVIELPAAWPSDVASVVLGSIEPRLIYGCAECGQYGDTHDGGYSWDTSDGETVEDNLRDGHAYCGSGHEAPVVGYVGE